MNSKFSTDILHKAILKGKRKSLITYFLDISMDMYEKDWKKAEDIFKWITEDDYKEYLQSKQKALESLLQVDLFIEDINQLLKLENNLHLEETVKKKLVVGRPIEKSDTFDLDNFPTIPKLLKELPSHDVYSKEARQIKRKLSKLGHKLNRGRRKK